MKNRLSLYEVFADSVASRPDAIAYVYEGQSWTWKQIDGGEFDPPLRSGFGPLSEMRNIQDLDTAEREGPQRPEGCSGRPDAESYALQSTLDLIGACIGREGEANRKRRLWCRKCQYHARS